MGDFTEACAAVERRVIEWRRGFHACPELSFEERETGETIRLILDGMGIPSVRVADTLSFYAVLEGSLAGPTVLLRADMDALPIVEISDQPYKSRREGVMHACGHDAHIAMLLGAAAVLSEMRESLRGRVIFCFQSAEEQSGGAEELLDALQLAGYEITRAAGLHVWSPIPTGEILILDGPAMAGLYAFKITMTGRGGHGSRPDLSLDPIKPLCDLALKLSALPIRLISPLDAAVVHVCQVEAGTRFNIYPDTAYLQGGVRFFRPEHEALFREAVAALAHNVASEWGVSADVRSMSEHPPVVNSAAEAALARSAADQTGLKLYDSRAPLCASDNMGLYLQKYPGAYAFLGVGNTEKGIIWEHHNARFDIDETALRSGVEFLCRYVLHP